MIKKVTENYSRVFLTGILWLLDSFLLAWIFAQFIPIEYRIFVGIVGATIGMSGYILIVFLIPPRIVEE